MSCQYLQLTIDHPSSPILLLPSSFLLSLNLNLNLNLPPLLMYIQKIKLLLYSIVITLMQME
jgi:hypothetical protein